MARDRRRAPACSAARPWRPCWCFAPRTHSCARSRTRRDGSARAISRLGRPTTGGDEVAAVAHAFNRMADDLAARQQQLSEADRARRQLLADVSHELMTPLTAIRGYAETLTLPQFGPSATDGQRYVRIIQEEVDRIERLVGDLLDLARFDAAGITMVSESVAVSELFDRVVARHEQAAREKQVTIQVALPDEEMEVRGDGRRLEQALQNLASNALRHTPRRRPDHARPRSSSRRSPGCASPTPAWGLRRSTCRTSSSGSTRPTRRARHRGPAWDCRSSRRSSSATADASRRAARRATAQCSRSSSRARDTKHTKEARRARRRHEEHEGLRALRSSSSCPSCLLRVLRVTRAAPRAPAGTPPAGGRRRWTAAARCRPPAPRRDRCA